MSEKFVARTVRKGASVHVIADDARPSKGAALLAHTHAALALLGMLSEDRPQALEANVSKVIGQRAVNYHVSQKNFERTAGAVRLTASGRSNFAERMLSGKVNVRMANAFMDLFVSGKADPMTEVPPAAVVKVKLEKAGA